MEKINPDFETHPCAASSGILAMLVCTFDTTTHGNVKLAASTPEANFAGIANENADYANNVLVQVAGVAMCLSDGNAAMNPGDDVIISSSHAGYVRSKTLAAGDANVYQIIGQVVGKGQVAGTLGLWVSVRLNAYKVIAA